MAAGEVIGRLRVAYRAGPVAERIVMTVRSADGRERSSTVVLRVDVGDATAGRPRRVRLDLGRISVFAEDDRLVAVNVQDPLTYFEARLARPVTPDALESVIPPLCLPQLSWALEEAQAGVARLPVVGAVDWEGAAVVEEARDQFIRATLAPGNIEIRWDDEDDRLRRLDATLGAAGSTRITLLCRRVEAGDPAAWSINLAGRARVESLSALRPGQPECTPGSRLPGLGLMTTGLDVWSLQEALRESVGQGVASGGAVGTGPVVSMGVLILFRPTVEGSEEDARAGWDMVEEAAARLRSPLNGPKIAVVLKVVGVLELTEVTPDRTLALAARWSEPPLNPAPQPLWTSTGRAMMDRFIPGAGAAMIIVDQEEKLVAAIPLDGRSDDFKQLREEFDGAMNEHLRAHFGSVLDGRVVPPATDEPGK